MTRTPEAARQRWVILAVIVLAQTVANGGPLGIPAIASLIRDDLGLTLTQAGSFLSVYDLGPVTMSFFAGMLADRWGTAKTLVLGFFGIGWNGVQHTLMAELAGPRSAGTAVGLGLAISSLGVTLGPPVFGWCVTAAGGYRGPWIGLSLVMLAGLGVLALVRERARF